MSSSEAARMQVASGLAAIRSPGRGSARRFRLFQPARGGGGAAIIGMLNGRNICMVFTTLRETNDGIGGLLA